MSREKKLPSEADLQKVLQVSLAQVHDAITLLERNGILLTRPQRGTYLRDFGKNILLALIRNILDNQEDLDPEQLMQMRILIEKTAIRESARLVNDLRLNQLWEMHKNYLNHQGSSEEAIDDDLFIHYKILEFSDDQVLKSQFCNLIPDIIFLTRKLEENFGRENRISETCSEHENIIKALESHDQEKAEETLEYHLRQVLEDSRKLGKLHRS